MKSNGRSGAEIQRLAAELLTLARTDPNGLSARVGRLDVREQAELALRLPPARRLELLLHAPKPLRLVRALPDQDLYLTVREVGPADAMPVLALASAPQLLHLLDLEAWRGDRFDAERAGAWIALLLEAGEPASRRLVRAADDELLVLLLQSWVRIEQIEYEDSAEQHGHGQGDSGTERGASTPDGYHRFTPAIPEHLAAIRRWLHQIYLDQRERYDQVVWSALWELPSEVEERALQWRNSRLEEHGFPGWEEALAVYAAPAGAVERSRPPAASDPDGLDASRSFLMVLPDENVLVPALDSLPAGDRERVLFELLSVANRILVADAADTGDPEAHRAAIRKAAGMIGIALGSRGVVRADLVANVLSRVPVIELFREGHARAVALQRRARELSSRGWASRHPRALELLDPPIRERVLGLLEPRPLYLEHPDTGERGRLREFRSPAEIDETAAAVEMGEILGALWVERLGLDVESLLRRPEGTPCFSALWNTMLAWHATRGELRADPLPDEVVADFLRTVASRRTASPDSSSRALSMLLAELARTLGLEGRQLAVLEGFGRYCLERLAEDCGSLDPGVPIDRRGVASLLL